MAEESPGPENQQVSIFDNESNRSIRAQGVPHVGLKPTVGPPPEFSRHKIKFLPAYNVHWSREGIFLTLALAVYLLTRLVGLDRFPIYFFTDEAVQTVWAASLLNNDLYAPGGEFLPAFFDNSGQYNLSTSVYLQLIPTLLFGNSIVVTRAVCVLATLLAALSVGLIIRKVFALPYAWTAVLFLSIAPSWFLHSRTAFETSLAVSFYAFFLFSYLMYRTSNPRWIYAAVAAGALTYYSYSPAQMVMGVTALLLFLADLSFHRRQSTYILAALGMAGVLALPVLRFELLHPGANLEHLRALDSYWVHPISLSQKLFIYWGEYLKGLNPFYWFIPNKQDLIRHVMKGYAQFSGFTFPFVLLGFVFCIRNMRQPAARVVLIALLSAPAGAALVALGITRILVMVIPLTILCAIGLAAFLRWAEQRLHFNRPWLVSLALFLIIGGYNIWMAVDALKNGPTWFTDYGLNGMQYGAGQVTAAINQELQQIPGVHIILSPAWANGTDTLMEFFFDEPMPFEMGSIEGFINKHLRLNDKIVFIMIPDELAQVYTSHKFKDIRIERIIPFPNGQPGFFFVHLRYVDNIDQILAAESVRRHILLNNHLEIDRQMVMVSYSSLDMGNIGNVFDGDDKTFIRTEEANPLEIHIDFPAARQLSSLTALVGGTATRVTVEASVLGGGVISFYKQVGDVPTPRYVEITFSQPLMVNRMRLMVKNINDEEPAHVHLWEVRLK